MERERPKRKAIPDRIKLEVVLRQDGRCPHCGERLGPLKGLNFDHRPAIINREVNEAGADYVPPQLDPEYIQAVHEEPCHQERTAGPGGERRITTAGSDIGVRDKLKRLIKKREAREAEAANLISPISSAASVANSANSELTEPARDESPKKQKSKFSIRSANRWPPRKPKIPYRRRGV